MDKSLSIGLWRFVVKVPGFAWRPQVQKNAEATRAHIDFMSEEHHAVRDFVVREMPRIGAPIPPESIAARLKLPLERVVSILDELEKRLTFLYRHEEGAVHWAYPVTVEPTPHRLTFSTGERVYAA